MLLDYASFHNPQGKAPKSTITAKLVVYGEKKKPNLAAPPSLTKDQIQEFAEGKAGYLLETSSTGFVGHVRPKKEESSTHYGLFQGSPYSRYRDEVGQAVRHLLAKKPASLEVEFSELSEEETLGSLVALELGSYSFDADKAELPKLLLPKSLDRKLVDRGRALADAFQAARHLINLPPNRLNPKTFAELVQKEFKSGGGWTLEIWNEARLKKEGMGLHLAVGDAASEKSRLVVLKYKPKKSKARVRLVGKGITFDSGGLDIKPSAGMRLMKKDMGGAAAVFGLALWARETKPELDLQFYFALAENAIDAGAYRPGDIYIARNGKKVEISNTDAEGRLVLGDALDVALESLSKNSQATDHIINVATLTGAGKVALGPDVASLFSNDDKLADSLLRAGQVMGDPCWRLPLYQPYASFLKSSFADLENAASSGYAGAITAALFLENFIGKARWAHLDIYAWKDSQGGVFSDKGGCGQAVQMLVHHLNGLSHLS